MHPAAGMPSADQERDPLGEIITLSKAYPSGTALAGFLDAVRRLAGADAALMVSRGGTGWELLGESSPSREISENLARTSSGAMTSAPDNGVILRKYTFRERPVTLLAVPVKPGTWLQVWKRGSEEDVAELSDVLRLAALMVPDERSSAPAAHLPIARLLELAGRPSKERLTGLASELALHLSASMVMILHREFLGWNIVAESQGVIPPKRSPAWETAKLAAAEIPDEGFVLSSEDGPAALREMARQFDGMRAGVFRLDAHWCVLAVWTQEVPTEIQSLTQDLLPAAKLVAASRRTLREKLQSLSRLQRKWILAGLLVLLGVMVFPIPLRVHAPVIIEPEFRRFVAAPFDSVLMKVHVDAGDLVSEGQLLAELDGKEIRERIAEIEAQASSARLQGASDLASSRFEDSAMSILQAQRAGHELEVLRKRQNALQIVSPVAGVVIEGDIEMAEGAALKLGRPILEIAPLDNLVAELAVREEDSAELREGQTILLRLNALPGREFRAKVQKINPRAETRDGRNVFVAEALLENSAGDLRPGMKGRAVVITSPKPIFWILFRQPWNTVRGWLFW